MTEEDSNKPSKTSQGQSKDNSKSTVSNELEEQKDENNLESEEKAEEVKQLEEKEHYELEFFSKEESLEKISNLEKELKEIKDKAQKLKRENDESKNKYMHLQAEFENAQKRWNKSRQDLRTQYTASVLKNFLPLYDSFKKAMDTASEAEKKILNGFYTQFMNIFKSYGSQPIEAKVNDPFDYSLHEALTSVEREDLPENSIVEIVQDGFKYDKEVIRYTKVVISKKPKPPEPEPKKEVDEEETTEESMAKEAEIEEESEEKKSKEKKSKKHNKEKDPDYIS
ncbi:MAG: nucleotide exchange factor GrpE [Promethearchaeota archaeon]